MLFRKDGIERRVNVYFAELFKIQDCPQHKRARSRFNMKLEYINSSIFRRLNQSNSQTSHQKYWTSLTSNRKSMRWENGSKPGETAIIPFVITENISNQCYVTWKVHGQPSKEILLMNHLKVIDIRLMLTRGLTCKKRYQKDDIFVQFKSFLYLLTSWWKGVSCTILVKKNIEMETFL